MRILALDVGEKRIGVALSDELLITAQGLETIRRSSMEEDLRIIRGLIETNRVTEMVVGLPLNMNGTYSEKTREVAAFTEKLKETVSIPVKSWDERLTTVQAEKALLAADISRAKRRLVRDKLAAQLILQSYLDTHKKG